MSDLRGREDMMIASCIYLCAAVLVGSPGFRDLVGLWHASECVGSGYNMLYAFLPDGAFIWRENSMDGMERLRERRGGWTVSGDTLSLSVDSVLLLEGGTMQLVDGGSAATDSEIVGGTLAWLRLEPPDTVLVHVGNFGLVLMDKNPWLPADLWGVSLDGRRYWRIRSGTRESILELLDY